jgi:hypothetical protein
MVQQEFKAFHGGDRQLSTTAAQKILEDPFINHFSFEHVGFNHRLIEGSACICGKKWHLKHAPPNVSSECGFD